MVNDKVQGGKLICGGLNPYSDRADIHSKRYYESVRKRKDDCLKISKNTGFTIEQVSLIKSHIFYTYHDLGRNGFSRFEPSYEMSESWRRLSGNNGKYIQPHDIILLKHELLEIQFLWNGYSQYDAHDLASKKFNYSKASDDFYIKMGFPMG